MSLKPFKVFDNATIPQSLSATTVFASSSNSTLWHSTYTTVSANSASWGGGGGNPAVEAVVTSTSGNWNSVYSTVNSSSATWSAGVSGYGGGSGIDTEVRALTANWESTYSSVSSTSGNWNSTYSTVNSNSATTWNYQGTDIKALTGNWENTYTNFSTQSANNISVYSTVQTNSATWGSGGGNTAVDTLVTTTSGNWNSVYSTVNSNSGTWGGGGGGANGTPIAAVWTASTTISGATTSPIPCDNTIPQNTEGAEILTISLSPTKNTNYLKVTFFAHTFSSNGSNSVVAIFIDDNVDATTAAIAGRGVGSASSFPTGAVFYIPAWTGLKTLKARIGQVNAGTLTWLATTVAGVFGGVQKAVLIVEEIDPNASSVVAPNDANLVVGISQYI